MKLNGESIEKHLKQVKICLRMDIMLDFFVKDFRPGKLGGGIHSKSEKVFGVCFFSHEKFAEKVRTSRHQNLATKVPKSLKSPKNVAEK